jgi:hypothetical protein
MYSVSPALPVGLSLNPSSGVISGTPTAASPQATYTITATNAVGSTASTLSLTVNTLTPPSTSYPAFTPPYPLVLSGNTPAVVIANPRVIPVFFSDSPDQADTLAIVHALVTSQEWTAAAEYGVGAATVGTPVYLTSAAPTTTTVAGISSYVAANAVSWGTLDGSEIVALYYPTSTMITDAPGASWHDVATTASNQQVPYTVMYNWTGVNDYLQYHELVEAATDPIPGEGYGHLNHDAEEWTYDYDELADLCDRFSSFYDLTLPNFYGVGWPGTPMAGIWSNSAVNAGHAPCTMAGSSDPEVGFGAYPVLPDSYVGPQGDTNASVSIAPGASVTIPVNFFSYGPLPAPITIAVTQTNTNTANTNVLTFSLDQDTGLNGSVAHLTITAPSTPLSSTTTYATFLITATIGAVNVTQPQSVFPGLVTN